WLRGDLTSIGKIGQARGRVNRIYPSVETAARPLRQPLRAEAFAEPAQSLRYASALGGSTIRTGKTLAIRAKSAWLCVITAALYVHAVAACNTSLRNARSRAAPSRLRRASTASA